MRTPEQRRAYIDTSRRSQPLAELQRKAAKAARRRPYSTMEQADLPSVYDSAEHRERFLARATDPGGFCYLCHQLGIWDSEAKRYTHGPIHKPRCTFAPDDGPYPGWAAAGSPRPQIRKVII